ncbi:hypothetical protein VARIO8X_90362 [Burkholderiales bacterium 8X]|nr:hypothetical protein VARIO8X_90362 [Burkholderiales bacterium 8X]
MGLRGLRQGRRGQGSGRPDQGRQDRPQGLPRRRAARRRGDRKGRGQGLTHGSPCSPTDAGCGRRTDRAARVALGRPHFGPASAGLGCSDLRQVAGLSRHLAGRCDFHPR